MSLQSKGESMVKAIVRGILLAGMGASMAVGAASTSRGTDFGICANVGGFAIPSAHSYRKELLSQVLSAKTAGIPITVEATDSPSCSSNPASGYPVIGSSNTYIRLD
jgi:hypothetical protein